MSKINFTPATGTPGALYCRYSGQTNPQGVYIELGKREVSVDYNGEIGNAVPCAVWLGRVRRYYFPNVPTVASANEAVEELLPLLQRVADGLTMEWDGNNHRGRLTDDAAEAECSISDTLDNWAGEWVEEWDAGEWFHETRYDLGVTAESTDAELEALAERLESEEERGPRRNALLPERYTPAPAG